MLRLHTGAIVLVTWARSVSLKYVVLMLFQCSHVILPLPVPRVLPAWSTVSGCSNRGKHECW